MGVGGRGGVAGPGAYTYIYIYIYTPTSMCTHQVCIYRNRRNLYQLTYVSS